MNIFALDTNPISAARMHCDKHVVKMILEYAQMLCTAHRVLDGQEGYRLAKNGAKIKDWSMTHVGFNQILYKATHVNHPCNIWARESVLNYCWLYCLFCFLCDEYQLRYNKIHLSDHKLRNVLKRPPNNIPLKAQTEFKQCMPDEHKRLNAIDAYRQYYIHEKAGFAKWKDLITPDWWPHGT